MLEGPIDPVIRAGLAFLGAFKARLTTSLLNDTQRTLEEVQVAAFLASRNGSALSEATAIRGYETCRTLLAELERLKVKPSSIDFILAPIFRASMAPSPAAPSATAAIADVDLASLCQSIDTRMRNNGIWRLTVADALTPLAPPETIRGGLADQLIRYLRVHVPGSLSIPTPYKPPCILLMHDRRRFEFAERAQQIIQAAGDQRLPRVESLSRQVLEEMGINLSKGEKVHPGIRNMVHRLLERHGVRPSSSPSPNPRAQSPWKQPLTNGEEGQLRRLVEATLDRLRPPIEKRVFVAAIGQDAGLTEILRLRGWEPKVLADPTHRLWDSPIGGAIDAGLQTWTAANPNHRSALSTNWRGALIRRGLLVVGAATVFAGAIWLASLRDVPSPSI